MSTKKKICEDVLVPLLKSNEVRVARTAVQIAAKISWFEAKFRKALQWAENTGVGVKADEGNVRFEQVLEQRFEYYFDLQDVFQEHAGMKPKATSDELDDLSLETEICLKRSL